MKMCIVIGSLVSGGAERVAVTLAETWANKGWQVVVITLSDGSNDFYRLPKSVNRITLGLANDSRNTVEGLWASCRRILALRRVLRQEQPSFTLGFMPTSNIL